VIVLDTNVTSELMKPAPSAQVIRWVRNQRSADLYTTAITVAEIGYGIERLPNGQRKEALRRAAEDIFSAFADQVLAFDAAAAQHYGWIVRRREATGTPIEGFDAQIASICRAHDAVLATRNAKDFHDTEIAVVDPWSQHP
jgi:toxin FitB